jgi:1-deoxy-D-xylulose 5-phosphate reductoisomerase
MASVEALDRLKRLGPMLGKVRGGWDGLCRCDPSRRRSGALRFVRDRGLEAVLAAIEHGKTIALANKEILVMSAAS